MEEDEALLQPLSSVLLKLSSLLLITDKSKHTHKFWGLGKPFSIHKSHEMLHKKNKATNSLEPNFIKEKPVVQVLRTNAYLWMQWSTQVRIQ